MSDTDDRARGALLGAACGDALGRPVEGRSSAGIADRYGRLTEMRAGDRPAGAGSAVTARVLRVARALVEGAADVEQGGAGTGGAAADRGTAGGDPGPDAGAVVAGVLAPLAAGATIVPLAGDDVGEGATA
ncbi:MAG: ADP-ribosylglycohydrolase family protein, partial [Haloferacaceae archaeon]